MGRLDAYTAPLRKRHPFVTLPRHRRRELVIGLKGAIRRNADMYGGQFSSRLLFEDGRPELYDQDFCFYVPGSAVDVLWNAHVRTAQKAFWDQVTALAYDQVMPLIGEEHHLNLDDIFEPAERAPSGKVLSYRMKPPARYDALGGLTISEKVEELSQNIILNAPPEIAESFTTDRKYVYGIGLSIVVDEPMIDRYAIERAIDRFFALGEHDWQANTPVARERLPTTTEAQALQRYYSKQAEQQA